MNIAPALAVEGLGHRFGPRRVLKDVSFSIAPGDFTVLLGLNGAGKTTLFSLATRLYAQGEGTIRIFGMDIRERMLECLRQMGIVFQQPTLDLDLTVEQNLFYHCALHGLSHREAARRIAAEIFDRILIAEPIRPLDGVVHVPSPIIWPHVAERCRDAALRRDRVRAGRKYLGDASGAKSRLAATDHRAQARAAGADDHDVVGVVFDWIGFAIGGRATFAIRRAVSARGHRYTPDDSLRMA